MKQEKGLPYKVQSVSDMHRLLALPKPLHPLVSILNFKDVKFIYSDVWQHFVSCCYCIALKKGCNGKMRYGQNEYDFEEGLMTFTSPGQILSVTDTNDNEVTGYLLVVHPDFVRTYPLAQKIKDYGFFSYAANEALFLSDKEEQTIMTLLTQIEQEYQLPIDSFSQDVLVAHIELLLSYANRFYTRQFITRKPLNSDLLTRLEILLNGYLDNNEGMPTVNEVARQLHVSANYLSDMLRQLTGQTTQQHIHHKLIEKAKEILVGTSLSVGEIAYQLGFGYPQSFNKLFKSKTNLSPLEYRQSFN